MLEFEPYGVAGRKCILAMKVEGMKRKQKILSLVANLGTALVASLYAVVHIVGQDKFGYMHPYLLITIMVSLISIAVHAWAIFSCSKHQMLISAISIPAIFYVLGNEYFRYVFHLVW